MVCLRNISVDTLHEGGTENNNNNNNNNNNTGFFYPSGRLRAHWLITKQA